eukprot:1367088-Amphidinium_carterae.1
MLADVTLVDASMVAPLFLEVFCYEARLSSHMKNLGFRTLSVDAFRTHVQYESAVTFVDLESLDAASKFIDVLAQAETGVVFLQPPSDTCNRTRSRPLPATWQGAPPQPLRSSEYPDGLPHLPPALQARVDKANAAFRIVQQ